MGVAINAYAVKRSGPQSRSSGRKQWGGAMEQEKEQRGVAVDGEAALRKKRFLAMGRIFL